MIGQYDFMFRRKRFDLITSDVDGVRLSFITRGRGVSLSSFLIIKIVHHVIRRGDHHRNKQ
jgi:hypothetical protein